MVQFFLDHLTQIIILSLVGGFISLDGLAWGQFMFGRPIVVAPLVGWFLGDMVFGLTVGALLELLSSYYLPIGSSVSPDFPLATLLTTASPLLAFQGSKQGQFMLWALLVSLIAAWISMRVEIYIRQINIGLAHRADILVRKNSFDRAAGLNLLGLGFFALRGFLLTFLFLIISLLLLRELAPYLPASLMLGRSMVKPLLMALGAAVVVELSAERRALWIFGVALAVSLLVLWQNWLTPSIFLGIFFMFSTLYLFLPGGIKFVRRMGKKA